MKKLFLFFFIALSTMPARADVITLNDGQIFEAKVLSKDDVFVEIEIDGILKTLFADEVASIEKSSQSTEDVKIKENHSVEPMKNNFFDADISGEQKVLVDLYKEYMQSMKTAAQTGDFSGITKFLTQEQKSMMETIDEMDPASKMTTMQFLAADANQQMDIVNAVVDGNKAILILEGWKMQENVMDKALSVFGVPDELGGMKKNERKPIPKRVYAKVFFIKENGQWYIKKKNSSEYHDPRAIFSFDNQSDQEAYPDISNHCAFTKNYQSCTDDACLTCFAKLNGDVQICEQLAKELEQQDPEFFGDTIQMQRESCYSEVAGITGDMSLCDQIKEDGKDFSQRKNCVNLVKMKHTPFLDTINLSTIDSDQDGLTDALEQYFNTSIGKKDSDGDGVSDYDEVHNFTNPIGEGKLGDHLR